MTAGTTTPFHRVRVVLTATAPATLHAYHAATLYALIAAAYGRATRRDPMVPDGLMLDAPEQCRVSLARGEQYAFGFTLLADQPREAGATIKSVIDGLRQIGAERSARPIALGGNFSVTEVEDLVAGAPLRDQPPRPMPRAPIESEADAAANLRSITLRFTSPLRMMRPKRHQDRFHAFFDRDYFDAGLFVMRLVKRLHELGLGPAPHESDREAYRTVTVEENRLVWMDFTYGASRAGSLIYGAVGRVRLGCREPRFARALAWGQHARVGQSTRFGQGAYRIDELGADPHGCRRAVELVDVAMRTIDLDEAAETYELPAGAIRRAAKELRAGRYTAPPTFRVPIVQPDGRERVLSIPTKLDRALQRAVVAQLAPALDRLFEDSSTGYRKGLGRERAARRVKRAFDRGCRYALRADFRRFFDSIDHVLLRDRLEAYLGDATVTDLLLGWVRAGSPFADRGVPTGAPISPLISNLFLDAFDEEVERDGAILVRYADDFLIAYRTKEEAERVFEEASAAAKALELVLNDSKTHQVELGGAFEFLGFRFERRDRWIATPTGEPRPLDEIGWHQAPKKRVDAVWTALPGETTHDSGDDRAVIVAGPGLTQVKISGGQLVFVRGDGSQTTASLDRVHELLLLGRPSIAGGALSALLAADIRTLIADGNGRTIAALTAHESIESPEAVAAQIDLMRDERWRLGLAKLILSAKVHNYAALADADVAKSHAPPSGAKAGGPSAPMGRAAAPTSGPRDNQAGPALRALADRCLLVDSMESLLGIEGAAAARWYGGFASRLPAWCHFERRVAPDAEDPGNIMLNMAMTALYRQVVVAVRAAGLVPTIGIFHEPRAGHAALASDLMEPFRHLMDRAVIHVAWRLRPQDFVPDPGGPFSVRIAPAAARAIVATVHQTFATACVALGKSDACIYRTHLVLAARALRRHLGDRSMALEVFRHPGPTPGPTR